MSAILGLLMIGVYKKQKQDSIEPMVTPNIEDKTESIHLEDEIYYGYYLVSGSFLIWENADEQYNTLTNMGYDCKILPETDGKGYYRVVIHWAESYDQVKEYQKLIKEDVPKTWILTK